MKATTEAAGQVADRAADTAADGASHGLATESVVLSMDDSRRLTGPNFLWDRPGAAMEVTIGGIDPRWVVNAWQRTVRSLLHAVELDHEDVRSRVHRDGATLVISAAIDACYSMCELNEAAWNAVREEAGLEGAVVSEAVIEGLRAEFAQEHDPKLLAVQAEAQRRDAPFLWDDDEVSVGFGATAQVWTIDQCPDPCDVDWDSARRIPIGLVTGTNGKSTTVRLAASIMEANGKRCGLTSTDFIRVGKEVLDTGDYSGPGGARMLMRHPDTEVAVLEVARGGMLRRGLGVEQADACVITNVAADHLGDYGIHTVEELVPAKFIVRRALGNRAPLILNADDEGVVRFAGGLGNRIVWFSLDGDNPVVTSHVSGGGTALVLKEGVLERREGGSVTPLVAAGEVPVTLGGAALYNVANALAAAALCHFLGATDEAITAGLKAFRGDAEHNPGRGNLFEGRGVRVLVDFAHNEHAVKALADAVRAMPAERRVLLMGQAGDRPDKDIADLVRAACSLHPDRLLVCDLPGYERGREPGEVPALIREIATGSGIAAGSVELFESPVAGVQSALDHAQEGDLLVLLTLTQRDEVLTLIRDFLHDRA